MLYVHIENRLLEIGECGLQGTWPFSPSLNISIPLPPHFPLPAPHGQVSTQPSNAILAISGSAILTNQNGLDALQKVKELQDDSLTPFQLFPLTRVPGPVLGTGIVYKHPLLGKLIPLL